MLYDVLVMVCHRTICFACCRWRIFFKLQSWPWVFLMLICGLEFVKLFCVCNDGPQISVIQRLCVIVRLWSVVLCAARSARKRPRNVAEGDRRAESSEGIAHSVKSADRAATWARSHGWCYSLLLLTCRKNTAVNSAEWILRHLPCRCEILSLPPPSLWQKACLMPNFALSWLHFWFVGRKKMLKTNALLLPERVVPYIPDLCCQNSYVHICLW